MLPIPFDNPDTYPGHSGVGSAPAGAVMHTETDGTPVGLTRKQYQNMIDS